MKQVYFWISGVVLVILISSFSIFGVDSKQAAEVLRSGKTIAMVTLPGIYFHIPFLENVKKIDLREQITNVSRSQKFIAMNHQILMARPWVRWEVSDISKFELAARGDKSRVDSQLIPILIANAGEVIKQHDPKPILDGSFDSGKVIAQMLAQQSGQLGIKIIQAGLGIISFSQQDVHDVLTKMDAAAKKKAEQVREQGKIKAAEILDQGKLEAKKLLDAAQQQAMLLTAISKAKAAVITEQAYQKNPEFY
ncbi:MAG: hypothetical protein KGL58_06150, partial [Pseudomonadota bacterium]|nr:hypothetical protein [Pseudomonadota bacterium]